MAYLFSNHCFSPPTIDNEPAYLNPEEHYESWRYKVIDYWSSHDTIFWLLSELCKLQVQNPAALKLEQFVHTRGCDLKRFSKEDFRKIIPQYGEVLYHQLQMKLRSFRDDVLRRELVAYHLRPNRLEAPEHLNMPYFDQPPPHPEQVPKQWPADRQDYECWAYKRLREWTPQDTLDCLIHELLQLNIDPASVRLDVFSEVYGRDLAKMTVEDFRWMLPEHGEVLYRQLLPKIRSSLESDLPWSGTIEGPGLSGFPHENTRPLSYAHRQQLSYAHPSPALSLKIHTNSLQPELFVQTGCFRWKPEGVFPGTSSDDAVLNLSKERSSTSTGITSRESFTATRSSTQTSGYNPNLFDQSIALSRNLSSTYKSNLSILTTPRVGTEYTRSSTSTSANIKQEQDPDAPLTSCLPDSLNKSTEDLHSPTCYSRDSSVDVIKTEDSQRDSWVSTGDSLHAKGPSLENSALDHGYDSDSSDQLQIVEEEKKSKEKRKPGRPRSLCKKDKSKGKVGRVWEFIRDLIMDPKYNPSVISWEDREKGLFRFRSGDQVAKLWGRKRCNPRMNFENFSRSIRQNYKKGYLLPVEKVRLVYQFGPKSTGWREGDPPTLPVSLPSPTPTPISGDGAQ